MGFPEVGKGDTDVSESRSSSRNSLRKGKEKQSRAVSPVQVCVIMICPRVGLDVLGSGRLCQKAIS